MATMQQIEAAAEHFSLLRKTLVDLMGEFQKELNQVKASYSQPLRRHVAAAKQAHAELSALVADSRELFQRPKSVVFHGIKVGYKKGPGKIEWESTEQVVKLIKKHFPDQADVLVITTERPAKEALEQLCAADLKKLGVTVEESGDVVFIKDTGAEVDKLVEAFFKDELEEQRPEPERAAA